VLRQCGAAYEAQWTIGQGGGVTMTFGYGVSDLGSGLAFFEPFSYEICVADLTVLVQAMDSSCLFNYGIDLHFNPLDPNVDLAPLAPYLRYYSMHT
jgi:hypothetical protein